MLLSIPLAEQAIRTYEHSYWHKNGSVISKCRRIIRTRIDCTATTTIQEGNRITTVSVIDSVTQRRTYLRVKPGVNAVFTITEVL